MSVISLRRVLLVASVVLAASSQALAQYDARDEQRNSDTEQSRSPPRRNVVQVIPVSDDVELEGQLIDPRLRQQPRELVGPVEERQDTGYSEQTWADTDRPHADSQPRRYQPAPRPAPHSPATGNNHVSLIRCGEVEVDPRGALCCDGIVYRRTPGADTRCCGQVAYDGEFYACCGQPGRHVIVRRAPVMPECCSDRSTEDCPRTRPDSVYESDSTGLGSTCCQVAGGAWRCCLRGESCCEGARPVDIPGFRPACCDSDAEKAALCCARTFENVGVLPECCDNDRLKPICCKRPDGSTRCCSATFGYCCGQPERIPVTPAPRNGERRPSAVLSPTDPPRRPFLPGLYTTTSPPWPDNRRDRGQYYPQRQRPPSVMTERPDNDEYPRERVDSPGVTARSTGGGGGSCCQNPSPTCCQQGSSGGGAGGGAGRQRAGSVVVACCRPVCCRQSSFNQSCCQRQRSAAPGQQRAGPGQL